MAHSTVRTVPNAARASRASDAPTTKRVVLLGATGSIGRQTIEVVQHLAAWARAHGEPAPVQIVGMAAGSNASALRERAAELGVEELALASATNSTGDIARIGAEAACRLVEDVDADIVVGAVVGVAGLPAILRAVEIGRDIALANKETLVAAGSLVVNAAQVSGAELLPVDSEHAAAWQCLGCDFAPPLDARPDIARLVLTASGGPFRTWAKESIDRATPEMALAHPTWSMGPKVTVDSASMTNKALEIIEAHWLFGLEGARIDAVVHPASLNHAIVEFVDGSALAQLAAPDMRIPIQQALTWPRRLPGMAPAPDLAHIGELCFEPVDRERFPSVALAHRCLDQGGVAGAVFNAANEAAVEAFLAGRIRFGRISPLVEGALDEILGHGPAGEARSLGDVLAADREARAYVGRTLA
jgi:1-deoxy-D-xylulose-5-phosphate reductoisomerase